LGGIELRVTLFYGQNFAIGIVFVVVNVVSFPVVLPNPIYDDVHHIGNFYELSACACYDMVLQSSERLAIDGHDRVAFDDFVGIVFESTLYGIPQTHGDATGDGGALHAIHHKKEHGATPKD
jgi:hypothetical protein